MTGFEHGLILKTRLNTKHRLACDGVRPVCVLEIAFGN